MAQRRLSDMEILQRIPQARAAERAARCCSLPSTPRSASGTSPRLLAARHRRREPRRHARMAPRADVLARS